MGNNQSMQRNTRQRTAILETLARQDEFRSAQQIHEQLRADGETVGLATVYRTLQTLTRSGRLDVLVAGDGESLYRQCEAGGHHHHLVCRVCGRTVEFLAPKLETAMDAIAAEHGYTEIDHTLEVFGLCDEHSAPSDPCADDENNDEKDEATDEFTTTGPRERPGAGGQAPKADSKR